jgi:hypothetical protein
MITFVPGRVSRSSPVHFLGSQVSLPPTKEPTEKTMIVPNETLQADGVDVQFDVADFDRVAEVMKPRRRRLSPEARLAAGIRLAKYQFGTR